MTSPATSPALPPRVRWLLAALTVGGVLSATYCAQHLLSKGSSAPVWSVVAAAAVLVVGDIALLQMRHGRNSISFTWGEAALITGVALAGWDWVVILTGPVLLARQLLGGRPWTKALFNAGNVVVAAMLARVVYTVVAPKGSPRVLHLLPYVAITLVAGALVYFLFVSVTIAAVVSWSQELSWTTVWTRGLQLRLVMFAGNSVAGLGAAAALRGSERALLALPFLALALYLAFNDYVRAQQERDSWRDLHHAAAGLNRVEPAAVTDAVRRGMRTLFGAEVSGLVLTEPDDVSTLNAPALLALSRAAPRPLTLLAREQPPEVAAEMRRIGVECAVLAPVSAGGSSLGMLLVGYAAPVRLKRRELAVLQTFADQTALSIQHARFFAQVDGQRRQLSSIVDNASDGILLVDGDGSVRAWNPAMRRMTSRAESRALGAPLEDVLPGVLEDGVPLTAAALLSRIEGGNSAEVGARITGADGGQRDISMAVSAVRSLEGSYAVIVTRDITAQREVQQAKEDFIATVSHELRTPLTPIKGYLALLRRPGAWTNEQQRDAVLGILQEQAGQLERLVEDLLSVSRMTHGQFDVELQPADVDAVVTRAVRDFPGTQHREVRHSAADGHAIAVCDPARLQQVVANLLSNADKYSPAGRPIEIAVRTGEQVEVCVRDHGDGVPVEAWESVFEPFHRLGDHLTRSTRGTGLGLHIARELVEAMSGRIWVDGAPGTGAVFHVTLPAARPAAARGLPPSPRLASSS